MVNSFFSKPGEAQGREAVDPGILADHVERCAALAARIPPKQQRCHVGHGAVAPCKWLENNILAALYVREMLVIATVRCTAFRECAKYRERHGHRLLGRVVFQHNVMYSD